MHKGWLLLLAACVTGCGINNNQTGRLRPLRALEIPTAPYRETATAALVGSLFYQGGCLLFRDEATHIYLLPVWPDGTVFNGTSVIYSQPGKSEQRTVLGEEFLMSGQQLSYTGLPGLPYVRFQQQCGAQPFFVSGMRPAN